MPFLFAFAVLAGAFLLFWVEPLVGRVLLPLLGGSPGVWNTCLAFFQLVVLGGYLLAHAIVTRLAPRAQVGAFVLLAGAGALVRPLAAIDVGSPPPDASPVTWLLGRLALIVGLPMLALSMTSPLLQRWYARANGGRDPYWLGAASNAGSFAGLLAFPFLLEPAATIAGQRAGWSVAFAVWVVFAGACGVLFARRAGAAAQVAPAPAPIPFARRLRWAAWSAVPSALLVGVTNWLSTDVASMPLLWIVPLALYLVTFVVSFGTANRDLRWWTPALLVLVVFVSFLEVAEVHEPVAALAAIHLLAFVAAARALHGALAEDRPEASGITGYFAWISFGGAAGGLFASLAAPLLFDWVVEYPLALVASLLLARSQALPRRTLVRAALAGGVIVGLWWASALTGVALAARVLPASLVLLVLLALSPLRPVSFALAAGPLLLAWWFAVGAGTRVQHLERSFFGVSRVEPDPVLPLRVLRHGNTTHGAQEISDDAAVGLAPLAYYARTGPAGDLFREVLGRGPSARIGLVGLGVGTLAAYARAGDRFTFFEIDPTVVGIARNPAYFTYLSESASAVEVIVGDGRLALAASTDRFDLVVLDAFSSDAVPVHLITVEALRDAYAPRLAPGGLIALHLSNRHLALESLAAAAARQAGLAWRLRVDESSTGDLRREASSWMVLARDPRDLGALAHDPEWSFEAPDPRARAWTDDRANVLEVLTWGDRPRATRPAIASPSDE